MKAEEFGDMMRLAKEMAPLIEQVAESNCFGCAVQHPSQKQHPCIMVEWVDKVDEYFDQAFRLIPCRGLCTRKMKNELKEFLKTGESSADFNKTN